MAEPTIAQRIQVRQCERIWLETSITYRELYLTVFGRGNFRPADPKEQDLEQVRSLRLQEAAAWDSYQQAMQDTSPFYLI